MRQMIALFVILMVGGLGGFFAWCAYAIRRDSRERFQLIQQRLEDEAAKLMSHAFHHSN
ncbi:hypothetical protein BH18ACI5_BH18ACI5_03370 [soil metagenome]